jgi:hypothetical protein
MDSPIQACPREGGGRPTGVHRRRRCACSRPACAENLIGRVSVPYLIPTGFAVQVSTFGRVIRATLELPVGNQVFVVVPAGRIFGGRVTDRASGQTARAANGAIPGPHRHLPCVAPDSHLTDPYAPQIVDGRQFRTLTEPWADTATSTARLMIAALGGLAPRSSRRKGACATTISETGWRRLGDLPHFWCSSRHGYGRG